MSNEIKALTMPKWGLAMTEGAVTSWLAEDGADLSEGDEILEIETTKITNVYESPMSGTLRRRMVEAGQTVPVVIFTHSGGHLSKLGMIRAEVRDGSESADIHG